MLTPDPLFEAHEHGRRFRSQAASERLRPPTTRRLLADTLRRAADRLEPAPVVPLDYSHR